jgi:hypothetical protein
LLCGTDKSATKYLILLHPSSPAKALWGIFRGVWLYYRVHTSRVMRPTHETLHRELAGKR